MSEFGTSQNPFLLARVTSERVQHPPRRLRQPRKTVTLHTRLIHREFGVTSWSVCDGTRADARTPLQHRRNGLGLLGSITWDSPAHAEPMPSPAAMCVTQAERAQEFYHAGDLAQARAEVALCAQSHCPPLVRNDCESWLQEWDHPTTSSRRLPAQPANEGDIEPGLRWR